MVGKKHKKYGKNKGSIGLLILGAAVVIALIGLGVTSFTTDQIRSKPWGNYHTLQLHSFDIVSPTPGPTLVSSCSNGAPIALDTTSQQSGDSVGSLTWTHTTSTSQSCNTLLLVGISLSDVKGRGSFAVGSVTYGGKNLTRLAMLTGPASSIGDYHTELWYLASPQIGSYPIVATFTSLTPGRWGDAVAGAETFSNVNIASPFGSPITNSGATAPSILSVPSMPGQTVVDVVGGYSSNLNVNPVAPQQQLWYRSVKPGQIGTTGVSSNKAATGNTTLMQWNNISSWAAIGVAINP